MHGTDVSDGVLARTDVTNPEAIYCLNHQLGLNREEQI